MSDMHHSFEERRQALLKLMIEAPEASADRDGFTPLQQRAFDNKKMRSSQRMLEEEVCASLSDDVVALSEAQLWHFVMYVLDSGFKGDELKEHFTEGYLIRLRVFKPALSPIKIGLLTVLVLGLENWQPGDDAITKDPELVQVKATEPGLWLELLYHTSWPLLASELLNNYEAYGFAVLAFNKSRWLKKFGRDSLVILVQQLKNKGKLKPDQLELMNSFLGGTFRRAEAFILPEKLRRGAALMKGVDVPSNGVHH